MAEEIKQGDKKTSGMAFKVVLGLVFLLLGALALIQWWQELLTLVKGGIGLFLLLAGIITLA